MDTPVIHNQALAPPHELHAKRPTTPARKLEGGTAASSSSTGPESAASTTKSADERGSALHPASTRQDTPAGEEQSARLRELADQMQKEVDALGKHSLEITYAEDADRFVVSVVDSETREVIRQIPPEALLEARRQLDELRGMLFDDHS